VTSTEQTNLAGDPSTRDDNTSAAGSSENEFIKHDLAMPGLLRLDGDFGVEGDEVQAIAPHVLVPHPQGLEEVVAGVEEENFVVLPPRDRHASDALPSCCPIVTTVSAL
jgi:hypothetical protein